MSNTRKDSISPQDAPSCYDAVGMYQSPISFNPGQFPEYPGFRSVGTIGGPSTVANIITIPILPAGITEFTVHYSKEGTPEQNISFYNSNPSAFHLSFGTSWFYLTSFHLHSPGEHTFPTTSSDGFLDMELHTVWRNTPDTANNSVPAVVIAIPITVGFSPNQFFNTALTNILSGNLSDGATVQVDTSLFSSVFANPGTVTDFPPSIIYPGSLTTYPYGEGVTFIVLNSYEGQGGFISSDLLAQFKSITLTNGQGIGKPRPVQNVNSRPIIVWDPN